MFIKNWKKEIFTIPNLLSLFRLLLIPVYMSVYLKATDLRDYWISGGILAISCLTDLVDGKIARHFNMISTLGKILDPLADKATQFTLTLCLSIRYPVLQKVLGLFVVKECFMLVMGIYNWRKGRMLSNTLMAGKVCTTVLFVSLILLVLLPQISLRALNIIAITDFIFLTYAFISYIFAYFGKNGHFQETKPT